MEHLLYARDPLCAEDRKMDRTGKAYPLAAKF
jgi:hypothetical protein